MHNFNYHRPTDLKDAVNLALSGDDTKFLAGGQTLIPTLKQRLAAPSDLIDLAAIADLRGISVTADAVVIGAAMRHAEVAASPDVQLAIPALAALAAGIGDPQVRNMGTIGGSVANNDPAADYPAACIGLAATIFTTKRTLSADDFFTGMFETALEPGEIVTKISFPIPQKANYQKFPNPASRYAMVGVFVAKSANHVRVAVTGAGYSVFRVEAMEQALSKTFEAAALEGLSVPGDDLNSDIHATADYRAHLIGVMAKRAVIAANGG
jgi:carbon-monoxide dehydrogenase medium subunit